MPRKSVFVEPAKPRNAIDSRYCLELSRFYLNVITNYICPDNRHPSAKKRVRVTGIQALQEAIQHKRSYRPHGEDRRLLNAFISHIRINGVPEAEKHDPCPEYDRLLSELQGLFVGD